MAQIVRFGLWTIFIIFSTSAFPWDCQIKLCLKIRGNSGEVPEISRRSCYTIPALVC